MRAFTLLFFILVSLPAWAWPPTFGAEFNFKILIETLGEIADYSIDQRLFRDQVAARCPQCRIETQKPFEGREIYIVHHPDGWNFTINLDPGVVEVQMSPTTLDQMRAREGEIQRLIFDVARDIGLASPTYAGHLHEGIDSTFDGDPLLFRNFIVDRMMYSNMFYRAFIGGERNSPTITMLGQGPEDYLRDVIAQFDLQVLHMVTNSRPYDMSLVTGHVPQNLFVGVPKDQAIHALMNAINDYVYVKQPQNMPSQKFQGLNLWHTDTVEDRTAPEAQSAAMFTQMLELYHGRIVHLKTFSRPIPFGPIIAVNSFMEAVRLFKKFASDASVGWVRARTLLPPLPPPYTLDDLFPGQPLMMCEEIFTP